MSSGLRSSARPLWTATYASASRPSTCRRRAPQPSAARQCRGRYRVRSGMQRAAGQGGDCAPPAGPQRTPPPWWRTPVQRRPPPAARQTCPARRGVRRRQRARTAGSRGAVTHRLSAAACIPGHHAVAGCCRRPLPPSATRAVRGRCLAAVSGQAHGSGEAAAWSQLAPVRLQALRRCPRASARRAAGRAQQARGATACPRLPESSLSSFAQRALGSQARTVHRAPTGNTVTRQ